MRTTVAILVSDLMFQPRVEATVRALGLDACVLAPADALPDGAALLVIDLHEAGIDAPKRIRAAKAAGARVLAFGRHTEPGVLRAAREAGADAAVARSQLVEELPALVAALVGSSPVAGP